jgi:hypothetical protein
MAAPYTWQGRTRSRASLTTLSAAWYNEYAHVPTRESGWDVYDARLSRYALYESYLNGTVYKSINAQAQMLKAANGLYRRIRNIYNPVGRQNKLLTAYIYGGNIDPENLTTGALPIKTDNPALYPALRNLLNWSRWSRQKSMYVRYGASLGDVFIKVNDDRVAQKVRMEVLHPAKIREMETDASGNITRVIIEYEVDEPLDLSTLKPGARAFAEQQRKSYLYTETIDKEWFRTYKDGEPFAYYTDMQGRQVTEWENEYGFVPLVKCSHADIGLMYGANAWYESMGKINEINDAASLLNDNLRKSTVPLLQALGMSKADGLQFESTGKDELQILYAPGEGARFDPITLQIDVGGALENIEKMLGELERDMPELALQRIRESGSQMTAPGVRAGYADAFTRIEEAQGAYDEALVRAMQMGVTIGGYNRYEGFERFNLASYPAGALEMTIKPRPIIGDSLSKTERITALGTLDNRPPAVQRLMLQELDYDEPTINAVLADSEERARQELRTMTDALFSTPDQPVEEADDGEDSDAEAPIAETA